MRTSLIQDISYTPVERKHLKMGIYILLFQSIKKKLAVLGFNSFFLFFLLKLKITFNPKTASFFVDWLNWKCVDTYLELLSFYWHEWNLLNQHRFQDMIAVKLIQVWTTFASSCHSLLLHCFLQLFHDSIWAIYLPCM